MELHRRQALIQSGSMLSSRVCFKSKAGPCASVLVELQSLAARQLAKIMIIVEVLGAIPAASSAAGGLKAILQGAFGLSIARYLLAVQHCRVPASGRLGLVEGPAALPLPIPF